MITCPTCHESFLSYPDFTAHIGPACAGDAIQTPGIWYDYTNQAWVVSGVYKRCGHSENVNCGCYGRAHEGETPTQTIIEQYGDCDSIIFGRDCDCRDDTPSVMSATSDQNLRNIVAAETTTDEQVAAAVNEWQRRHPPEQITDDFALATTPGKEQFAISMGKWFLITDIVDSIERANEICGRNSHIGVIGERDGLFYLAENAPLKGGKQK